MPVITIAREYGAGALRVSAMLSQRLGGLEVVDQQLVADVASRLGLTRDDVATRDEHRASLIDRFVRGLVPLGDAVGGWPPPTGSGLMDPEQAVFELTEELIRATARRGDAIVVGRGGAFVLGGWPGVLHVFLRAPEAVRVRTVMAREGLTEEAARHRLHRVDAGRADYMCAHYGTEWRSPEHYDVVLDVGRLGHEGAVDVILAALPHAAGGATRGAVARPVIVK